MSTHDKTKTTHGEGTRVYARAPGIRSSARKLNLVAASIRGKGAAVAMNQLAFEKRRVAQEVRKVLQAAIANAENNDGLNVDRLFVVEAWVGRTMVVRRMHPRARGRSAAIEKPFSNLTIVVQERIDTSEKETARQDGARPKPSPSTTKGQGSKSRTSGPSTDAATGA